MKIIFLVVISLFFASCAHSVHQVQTSDFNVVEEANSDKLVTKESGKIIQAQAEQFVVLGFTQQTNYVNQAYDQLLQKCKGSVVGITTQLSSSLSFFSWTNKVLMQGFCIEN